MVLISNQNKSHYTCEKKFRPTIFTNLFKKSIRSKKESTFHLTFSKIILKISRFIKYIRKCETIVNYRQNVKNFRLKLGIITPGMQNLFGKSMEFSNIIVHLYIWGKLRYLKNINTS